MSKTVLIIIVIVIWLIIILPFVLKIGGVNIFQLGSVGGGFAGSSSKDLMLRSADGGNNWDRVTFSGDTRLVRPSQVLDLEFYPGGADTLFTGTKSSGLWKSTDGGATWQKVFDKTNVLNQLADVYKVGLSRSNPNLIYLAVFQSNRGRVLKSEDGGASFREVYFVSENRFGVFDLFVDPANSDHVIIATGQGGVLETRNGGRTWRVLKWFTDPVTQLLVNPAFSNEMLAVTSKGKLFKTFDDGDNWTELNYAVSQTPAYPPTQSFSNPFAGFSGLGGRSLDVLISDPNVFSTLYLGSSEGVFRSPDGGFSWERLNILIPPEALPVTAVAVYPQNSNTIFVVANSQLHQSTDGGVNWSTSTIATSSAIKSLLINPLKPQIMFAVLK